VGGVGPNVPDEHARHFLTSYRALRSGETFDGRRLRHARHGLRGHRMRASPNAALNKKEQRDHKPMLGRKTSHVKRILGNDDSLNVTTIHFFSTQYELSDLKTDQLKVHLKLCLATKELSSWRRRLPATQPDSRRFPMSHEAMQTCIDTCNDCATACDHCASSCLSESDVQRMTQCISLDIECAAICRAAAASMARGSEFAQAICGVCADICEACAVECEQHPMDHCKACAEACRACAKECRAMASRPMSRRSQKRVEASPH
jgi:hypothetical protein